jgi:phosphatidylserine decarboxylase
VEARLIVRYAAGLAVAALLLFLFWRYVWFFRNPARVPPAAEGVLGPADGTVVYVRQLGPGDEVITLKQGLSAKLTDIVHEDVSTPKLHIGIFMSPFDVHYNRAPLQGSVEFVRHHPGRGPNLDMGAMHWRILTGREPFYEDSLHIVQNERTVTKINGRFRGVALPCYVVQIASKNVSGIDSYVKPGDAVQRGAVFGMIRIGSQVDVVVPWVQGMQVHVRPGDRVVAGETILVD